MQIDESLPSRQNSGALQTEQSYEVCAFNIGFVIFPQLTQLDDFRAAPNGCARMMRLAFAYRLFGATAAALERSVSIKLIR